MASRLTPEHATAARPGTRGRDGVTTAEREQPFTTDPRLLALEREAAAAGPDQLPLFAPGPGGQMTPLLGGLPALEPVSSLEMARAWYRRELEQDKRPKNTVESYSYDLMVLEKLIGHKPINRIDRRDIARYLGEANGRSTRKRRLTSARRFFRFLIDDARIPLDDPTDGYYPHAIPLRSPVPLFAEEQAAILAAAAADEPWSLPAIWLMLRLGLSRSELLALRREHIDLEQPFAPVVYIFYEDIAKRGKERKLAADAGFAAIHQAYLGAKPPVDLLFTCGPQAVNGMVDRVRQAAGLQKDVTPQTLRHTFAIEKARQGADEDELLALLGLADDPRNRASVRRYVKLAEPPL
ncbi:MAG: tyrosine-type recombinase/integrase [Chloroflexia bacterium]|nr:tyrosine-type recombinase/integrase [Chloroflexia bacterium]